jgi:benzodiazapine receptor
MRRLPSQLVFLALTLAAAFVASRFLPDARCTARHGTARHGTARQDAAFNPSNWIFPLAWSVLYVL